MHACHHVDHILIARKVSASSSTSLSSHHEVKDVTVLTSYKTI